MHLPDGSPVEGRVGGTTGRGDPAAGAAGRRHGVETLGGVLGVLMRIHAILLRAAEIPKIQFSVQMCADSFVVYEARTERYVIWTTNEAKVLWIGDYCVIKMEDSRYFIYSEARTYVNMCHLINNYSESIWKISRDISILMSMWP